MRISQINENAIYNNKTNRIGIDSFAFKKAENPGIVSAQKNIEVSDKNFFIDDENEKSSGSNNATALAIGLSALFLGGAIIYSAATKGKGGKNYFKNKTMYNVSDGAFASLKDDKKIPTLDSCKSIDENLRKFLQRQVNLSKISPEELKKMGGANSSRRILLYGPAGVGKTHFARIYAKTLGAEYMEIGYRHLNERFTGDHIEKIKSVFDDIIRTASLNEDKNYVVTFNEIDALMPPHQGLIESGGGYITFKKDERNLFLNYLDDISEKAPNVTIIGTTNSDAKKSVLDEAGMSRFSAKIKVDYPNKKCLYEALKMHFAEENGGRFVRENDKKLEDLAEKLYNRRTSFRNLDDIVMNARHNRISNYLETKDTNFKFEYLKDAELAFDVTDGEAAEVAKSVA